MEYLRKTFSELANTFTIAINDIKNKVKKYILNRIVFNVASDVYHSHNNEDDETKQRNNKLDPTARISASELITMDGKKWRHM